MDIEALVVDAFAQLGIEVRLVGVTDHGVDLVLEPEGVGIPLQLKHRSLVTDDAAKRMLAETSLVDAVLLVVADRVTDAAARKVLTPNRAGYLDLRGRLVLHASRLVIDAEVESVKKRAERSEALAGNAGLEAATALLMQPDRQPTVRGLARELGRSASTTSEILALLRRDGLIDGTNVVVGTDLFWQVANHWPNERIYLGRLPSPGDAKDGQAAPSRLLRS